MHGTPGSNVQYWTMHHALGSSCTTHLKFSSHKGLHRCGTARSRCVGHAVELDLSLQRSTLSDILNAVAMDKHSDEWLCGQPLHRSRATISTWVLARRKAHIFLAQRRSSLWHIFAARSLTWRSALAPDTFCSVSSNVGRQKLASWEAAQASECEPPSIP